MEIKIMEQEEQGEKERDVISKDIYLYICWVADDITSLKMLSVNKYFHSEYCFRIVFGKKYPLLSVYRLNDENWINFYKRKIYCILQLRISNNNYIYDPSYDIDPEKQFLSWFAFHIIPFNDKEKVYNIINNLK